MPLARVAPAFQQCAYPRTVDMSHAIQIQNESNRPLFGQYVVDLGLQLTRARQVDVARNANYGSRAVVRGFFVNYFTPRLQWGSQHSRRAPFTVVNKQLAFQTVKRSATAWLL